MPPILLCLGAAELMEIFKYPITLAARVAVQTVLESLVAGSSLERVVFCCFSKADLAVYQDALG
jgi:O-acetyl-ADP-ribose deacetylase